MPVWRDQSDVVVKMFYTLFWMTYEDDNAPLRPLYSWDLIEQAFRDEDFQLSRFNWRCDGDSWSSEATTREGVKGCYALFADWAL